MPFYVGYVRGIPCFDCQESMAIVSQHAYDLLLARHKVKIIILEDLLRLPELFLFLL